MLGYSTESKGKIKRHQESKEKNSKRRKTKEGDIQKAVVQNVLCMHETPVLLNQLLVSNSNHLLSICQMDGMDSLHTIFIRSSQQPCEVSIVSLILQGEKLRFREVRSLAQSHKLWKWQSWNL